MRRNRPVFASIIATLMLAATPLYAAPARPADNAAYAALVPAFVLVNADRREGVSLSGPWHYSVDPYRDGQADFLGRTFKVSQTRGADVNVEQASRDNPNALYEYDLGRAPVADIPGAWIGYDPQLRYYNGLMWYQKRFDAPDSAGKRIFLRFGAADYHATVYLNGQVIGEHDGGFTPFAFDVTDKLRAKDNNLVVAVDSTRTPDTIPPTVTDWETYGGITRDVTLVTTPQTYIDDDFIHLTKDGRIAADVALEGAGKAGQAVEVSVPALKLTLKGTTGADGRVSLSARAPAGLKRWSPDTPTLYDVTVTSGTDTLTDRIGFRTIEVKGSQIILNGKPIFLRGISLHEEEFGPDPSRRITPEASRALLNEIKTGLHGNFVRLAHYPHNETTTRMADELGLLVWSEIPVYWSVNFTRPETLQAAQKMIAENILRDRNRASIIIWSVGNETPVSDARNHFLGTLAQEAHDLDGSRLVSAALNTATASGPNDISIKDPLAAYLDVIGINTYNGWYGNGTLEDVRKTVWHSDYDKPMIFSEFGAGAKYGYHDPAQQHRFSEDYQASYYKATLEMADHIPFLAGMSPWILKDFRSPRRQNTWQQGWNRKGLLSETGQRKEAFFVLGDYYQKKAGEQ
ncbi:MAG: beta galactosidase jelly roll domain-containing protein [Asticcacaulis sp.]|nr:beta galactosidase jelly roll domain-containing protein [Asticcacaulis sp.]